MIDRITTSYEDKESVREKFQDQSSGLDVSLESNQSLHVQGDKVRMQMSFQGFLSWMKT
jgi:hypothetical protein